MIPTNHRDARALPPRMIEDTGVRILFGVFLVAALCLLWHEMEPALTFRPVDAEVVGSSVAKVRLSTRHSTHNYYQPEVFYRYEVAGVPRMGNRYSRTSLFSGDAGAQMVAHSFASGGKVRAWYNPLHPDEAVLSRRPNTTLLLFAWGGLIFLFLCSLQRSRRTSMLKPASAPIE